MTRSLATWVALAAIAACVGCPGFVGGAGSRPDGFRLVEGQLLIENEGIIGRQVAGVQLAAVVVEQNEGTFSPKVYTGDVLQPNDRFEQDFVVTAPIADAFHLILQIPSGAGSVPGEWQGVLRFSDGRGGETSLIPAGGEDLELGVTTALDNDPAIEFDNVLRTESSGNPLAQMHHDEDDLSDLLDDDDDGDLIPDDSDEDIAGDGIEDALQQLSALPDGDGDGIPDAFVPR